MSRAKAGKLGGKSKKISGSALAKCEGLGYNHGKLPVKLGRMRGEIKIRNGERAMTEGFEIVRYDHKAM